MALIGAQSQFFLGKKFDPSPHSLLRTQPIALVPLSPWASLLCQPDPSRCSIVQSHRSNTGTRYIRHRGKKHEGIVPRNILKGYNNVQLAVD